MIPKENESTLKVLHNKLLDVDWRLIGSTNLGLQGVDVHPKDIDIRIKVDDISKVQQLLQEYCTKRIDYSKTDKFASYLGKFSINKVNVDVMAGVVIINRGIQKNNDVFLKNPVIVEIDGLAIPCVDLNTEYNAYIDLGRNNIAELIKNSVNTRH